MALVNLLSGRQRRNRHRELTYRHGGRGGGRRGDVWRELTEIYSTMCKTDSQWEFAVWFREVKQGFCDRLKGRGLEAGTWVYLCWFLVVYDRKPQNSGKQLSFNLKIKMKILNVLKENSWHWHGVLLWRGDGETWCAALGYSGQIGWREIVIQSQCQTRDILQQEMVLSSGNIAWYRT